MQVPGTTNRVAAVWYSATSFTVDVNLTDGQTHDLELYFLDWDSKGRGEQVQLSDAGTGKVLATETISSFTNGVYLDWKVSGNLLITITGRPAPMPCSMACSDSTTTPTSTATASFLQQDTTKQGDSISTYGSRATTSSPARLACRPTTRSPQRRVDLYLDYDVLGPPRPAGPGSTNLVAAVWYSATSFTVNVNLADGQTHDLELYFDDWDSGAAASRCRSATPDGQGAGHRDDLVVHQRRVPELEGLGQLVITITRGGGQCRPQRPVPGLDVVAAAHRDGKLLKQDATTQGSWIGIYGARARHGLVDLPASRAMTRSPPAASETIPGPQPPPTPVPADGRLDTAWPPSGTPPQVTVDVNLAVGQTHDLELYFVDWDNQGRSEQVQLSDAGTGKVLDTETISSFTNGVYLDWKVSGNLLITITRRAGANAVLNGVFLDSTSVGVASYEVGAASRVNIGSLPVPVTNGAPIARESSGGFAIGSAGGTVTRCSVRSAADDDAPPGWSAHDLALGQVSREGRSRGSDRFSTRFRAHNRECHGFATGESSPLSSDAWATNR